jgi:hypothetical protein
MLFLLSVRSIALVEGRIVEALLGVRMPRRPLFANREAGWGEQIKGLLLEGRTWTAIAYMILQLPLGLFYFSILIVLLTTSLALMASPILQTILDEPLIHFGVVAYQLPLWLMPLVAIGGFILLLATMHLAKLMGRAHGALAKILLVGGALRTHSHSTHMLDRLPERRRQADVHNINQEEPMDRREETERRTETWIIILAVAAALITLGTLVMMFLTSS